MERRMVTSNDKRGQFVTRKQGMGTLSASSIKEFFRWGLGFPVEKDKNGEIVKCKDRNNEEGVNQVFGIDFL